jgi:glycine betaine/proline transport system permease protein
MTTEPMGLRTAQSNRHATVSDLHGAPVRNRPADANGGAARPRKLWAIALAGPAWAAMQGRWMLFLLSGGLELAGLLLIALAVWPPSEDTGATGLAAVGIVVLLASRCLVASMAARPQFLRARPAAQGAAPVSRSRLTNLLVGAAAITAAYGLTLWRFVGQDLPEGLAKFPASAELATTVAKAIDQAVRWSIVQFAGFFDLIRLFLAAVLNVIELAFVATPWPVVSLVVLVMAWRLAGRLTLLFTAVALVYLGFFGFWEKSMATLALVATSVVVCVALGLPIGILCAKSRRVDAVVEPILDVMQTLPTFVYLLPAVAFFSIGKPPGVLATVIFAMPPMIRLTALGIKQVPAAAREAALSLGAAPLQLLFKVELPLATPSLMAGINQTIMMSLSMVVIAALIGAGGLGLDVVRALNFLQTGQGILAGIAIVLVAMALDRIVRGPGEARRRRPD